MIEPQSPKGTLLLVATDQVTTGALSGMSATRGFGVHALTTGEQVLKQIRHAPPDLLLIGGHPPDMDVLDLCRRLRAIKARPTLPVVVLSDTTEPATISELVTAGATDVLMRSLGGNLYQARLEAHLELAALRNELALRDARLKSEVAGRRQVEESVRAAEESGRELVGNLSEVIYTTEPDGTLTYVSPGIERLLGYRPEEIIGRPFRDIVHPGTQVPLSDVQRRVLAGHREENEYRLVTKTGGTRWAHASSQPVYSGDQVVGLQGVLTDVTLRKLAEEQIRRQNEFLTTVLESLTHPFYVLNVHDYTIEMANSAARFERLTGDATCYALTHRRDAPCSSAGHPCPIEELKKTGKPVTVEHMHYNAQGQERFVEVHSYPLFDNQGKLSRAIEYTFDITERKQAEQALRSASEEAEQARQAEQERRREADQRRRVAESLAGVVAALNSEQPLGHVLDHIAAQARKLLDNQAVAIYGLDQARGDLILQVSQGPVRADPQALGLLCSLDAIAQTLASRQHLVVNSPDTPPSDAGHHAPVPFQSLLAMPIVIKDRVYGGMVMCCAEPRNFTAEEVELASVFANQIALAVESERLRSQREQAAAAAERNRLARDLHDSVTQALFSASLVAEILPQVWERDPDLAREGLQELSDLTRGALAEMRTMLLELRPTAVIETRLDDLLRQLAEAITTRVGLLVSYEIEPSPSLPPEVHVTFYRIAQEALNNVLKHAKATRVIVKLLSLPPVDPRAVGEWQGQLKLGISDDGQGIPAGEAEPDHLGLGIMHERAEAVGAELSLESHPGSGTCVTLIWPGETPAAEDSQPGRVP